MEWYVTMFLLSIVGAALLMGLLYRWKTYQFYGGPFPLKMNVAIVSVTTLLIGMTISFLFVMAALSPEFRIMFPLISATSDFGYLFAVMGLMGFMGAILAGFMVTYVYRGGA